MTRALISFFVRCEMWPEEVRQALREWVGPSRWFSFHPADQNRFFNFIDVYWRFIGEFWDERETREIITREARAIEVATGNKPLNEESMSDAVRRYQAMGSAILKYLEYKSPASAEMNPR